MAVSGSTDANKTAVEIITHARRQLGINAEEESLQNNELQVGLDLLTMMLKDWEADPSLGTWLYTEGSLSLAASDASYTFQTAGDFTTIPFEITQMRVSHDGGNEIEMVPLSREDYYRLPNRTTTGFPTQFFYDRQRDGGTLYVWPCPADNDYDVTFTYRRRIMDTDAGTDNLDLPPEWQWAVINNLAVLMIPVYGRGGSPEAAQVITQAEVSMSKLKSFDAANDRGSITIEREPYYRRR